MTGPVAGRRLLVAVCTYRRPAGLGHLLEVLADVRVPAGVAAEVLVVDNDPAGGAAVPAYTGGLPVRLRWVGATNIAVARNAVLDEAAGFDLLALIDDDELPERGWLVQLVAALDRHDCDVVIGRVAASLPAGAPGWLKPHYEVEHGADGRELTEGISGNALLRVCAVHATAVRFDPALGRSGGEDQYFFRQLHRRGLTIRYAAGALTTEQVPAARLGLGYLARRSMRAGNTLGLLDGRLMRTPGSRSTRAVKACGWAVRGSLRLSAALLRPPRRRGAELADGVVQLAFGLGMVPGLAGFRQEFYGTRTGWRRMGSPSDDPAWHPATGRPRVAWVLREDPRTRNTGHRRWLGSLLDSAAPRSDTVVLLPTRAGVRMMQHAPAPPVRCPDLHEWRGWQVGSRRVFAGVVAWWAYRRLPGVVQYAVARVRRTRRRAEGVDHVLGKDLSADQWQWVAEQIDRWDADTVVFDSVFSLLPTPPGVRRVVLTSDVLHQRAESFAALGYRTEPAGVSRDWEAARLCTVDAMVAIQWDEARALATLAPELPVVTAPPTFQSVIGGARASGGELRCVFVGNGTAHNVDGLRWLMDDIWPTVHERTGARLRVVGAVASQVPPGRAGVDLLGQVDDLDAEYAAASVVLVPLRAGSGLKIKLAEAICHGRAAITTSVGAQGLGSLQDPPFVVADDAAEFAARTVDVLTDPTYRRRLEEAARTAARLFDPGRAHDDFIRLLINSERSVEVRS